MNGTYLDFEKPIAELEARIQEMRKLSAGGKVSLQPEIAALEEKLEQLRRQLYSGLTAWQRVQLARHPQRPYTLDYIRAILTDFLELHGDRLYGDDKALLGGLARLDGRPVMVLGHQKGRDTKENLRRNFGSAHPEGYRKALRLMQLAEKFHLPILILIDTPGAYPGIGAEERGQAHSIAFNLRAMVQVAVPILCIVIGEGGSGGALGIGIGDRICVLENAYYSVISPEGCAAILWKDRKKAPEAAEALQMTAKDLLRLGLIEEIIEEPLGGAHRDPALMAGRVKEVMVRFLHDMADVSPEVLLRRRYERFRKIGTFEEGHTASHAA